MHTNSMARFPLSSKWNKVANVFSLETKLEGRKPLEFDIDLSFTTTASDSVIDRYPGEFPELFKVPSVWSFVTASAEVTKRVK